MSNDETSGGTGGNDTHNHQWYSDSGRDSWQSNGSTLQGVSTSTFDLYAGHDGWMLKTKIVIYLQKMIQHCQHTQKWCFS